MGSNPRSSPPPAPKRLPKEDAKQVLMGMIAASPRPLLVGVAAVRLGVLWSIDETSVLFDELVAEKRIRAVTPEERRVHDIQEGYVLVGVDPKK